MSGVYRTAAKDIDNPHIRVKAGERVFVNVAEANKDVRVSRTSLEAFLISDERPKYLDPTQRPQATLELPTMLELQVSVNMGKTTCHPHSLLD